MSKQDDEPVTGRGQPDTGRSGPGIGRSEPLRVAVSAATVALWVADLLVHHSSVHKVLGLVLIAVLARVTVTDLEHRRIHNLLIVTASVAALLIGLVMHPAAVPAQLLWAFAVGIFLLIFALVSRGGLGMGDVKLGFVLGLFLSRAVVGGLVIGMLASAVCGLLVILTRGFSAGLRTTIPLGPFLALGGVVAALAGPVLFLAT